MLMRPAMAIVAAFSLVLFVGVTGCEDGHDHDEHAHFTFTGELKEGAAATNTDHVLSITIKLKSDGTAVEGATVSAEEPWMDAHNHGSGTAPTTFTEVGGGVYEISPIRFIMPGEWRIKIHATKGEMHEHYDYKITVQ